MSKFSRVFELIKNPKELSNVIFFRRVRNGFYDNMSDEEYLKKMYKQLTGKKLNLENPKTFNEKLQWLKLHNRKPEYSQMVDKYGAKQYVAEKMGEEYIIPTLGVWENFDDIDFDALPEQFVLKCTHDSGGLVICKDKSKLDIEAAKKKINRSMKRNFYLFGREWPYKNVKPRIIAEKFMSDLGNEEGLVEYKFFCFNGEVKIILVCKGGAHGNGRTNDYCDLQLNRYPFTSLYPNSEGEVTRPEELPELIAFAEKLSAGIPQVRIDTYLAGGKIYFGEMTFFHNSGFCTFNPEEWDAKIGEWIVLPEGE